MTAITKTPGFVMQAAVAAFLIIKHGTADGSAALATAPTDALIGTAGAIDIPAGDIADSRIVGVGEVRLGAAITRGQPITTDANSKGVPCVPGAGVTHQTIGYALQSGVADDVIRYHIARGDIRG